MGVRGRYVAEECHFVALCLMNGVFLIHDLMLLQCFFVEMRLKAGE